VATGIGSSMRAAPSAPAEHYHPGMVVTVRLTCEPVVSRDIMRVGRHPGSLALSLLIAGLILLFSWSPFAAAPAAQAHAFVIGSEPVDGSTVPLPPKVVRIFFNGEISPASQALVFDPEEHLVNAAASFIPPGHPRELDTPLRPHLAPGSYLVRWTALAENDGRTTQGAIGFNIGYSSSGLPGQPILGPSTSNYLPTLNLLGVLTVAWEWLVLLALTFWVGLLVMEQLVMERRARSLDLLMRARERARPLHWLVLTTLLVGELISLLLRSTLLAGALNRGGIDLQAARELLFTTRYGLFWLVRAFLTVVALLWLAWTARRPTPGVATAGVARVPRRGAAGTRFGRMRERVLQEYRVTKEVVTTGEAPAAGGSLPLSPWATALWLTLAALYLLTYTLTSDEVQQAQPPLTAIVLSWLYLTAQSLWLGGLAYLGYVLLPLLAVVEPDHHADLLVTLTRRFTPVLVASIGVLLVSQLFLAEALLPGAEAWLTTGYGRTLLVRLALLALLLLLSAFVLFRLGPRLARQTLLLPVVDSELPARRTRREALLQTERRLGRLLRVQSWLGAAVLLCTALMNFFAPPILFPNVNYAQTQQPGPASTGAVQTQQVDGLSVSLFMTPARSNASNIVVIVIEDEHGRPISDARVSLTINMVLMDMGTTRQTIARGNPLYSVTLPARVWSMAGLWRIDIVIERPGQPPLQTSFQVMLS
jgi:putative copper export protein/methionine-rich copper-binding protein CopC